MNVLGLVLVVAVFALLAGVQTLTARADRRLIGEQIESRGGQVLSVEPDRARVYDVIYMAHNGEKLKASCLPFSGQVRWLSNDPPGLSSDKT